MTVRYDRVQQGLIQALQGVASTVRWAHSEAPVSADGDMVVLRPVTGPVRHIRQHAFAEVLTPVTAITLTITGATTGARTVLRINDFDYRHDVEAGEGVTDVRDALLADIAAGEAGRITPSAVGADQLTLTPDSLGALWGLEVFGQASAGTPTRSTDSVRIRRSTVRQLIAIDCYSRGRELRNGAQALVDAAQDELSDLDKVAELARYGVGLWGFGTVNDLSAVVSGRWETRASVDLTIAAKTVSVRPVPVIETVDLTIDISE